MVKFQGNKLKALLAENKISQGGLANALDMHRNSVYQWVNGKATPDVGTVLRILEALGYDDSAAKNKFWSLYS